MGTVPIPQGATLQSLSAPPATSGGDVGAPIPQGASLQPLDQNAPPADTATAPPQATISATHEPTTFIGKFGRWAENVSNDIKNGTDETGIGTILKKMGAHGVYNGNSEAVGDFMASLPLGLLKAAKGSSEVSPAIMGGPKGQTWQGVKDLVGGGLQALTIPASFAGPEESALSKEGLLSDAASVPGKIEDAVSGAAGKVKGALSQDSVQPSVHGAVREAVSTSAKEAGAAGPSSPSLAKVAEEGAENVLGVAKDKYKMLDEATGGRVQRFSDRLRNIKRQLNSLTGTEEDAVKETALLKAQSETEEGMKAAFKEATEKGVDPSIEKEASANFKKSQALDDLDTQVKRATKGMRPDVGDAKAASGNPEIANPERLFERVNNLHRSGRLQDALGDKGADTLLSKLNEAVLQYRKIGRNQRIAKTAGKYIAGGLGVAEVSRLISSLSSKSTD